MAVVTDDDMATMILARRLDDFIDQILMMIQQQKVGLDINAGQLPDFVGGGVQHGRRICARTREPFFLLTLLAGFDSFFFDGIFGARRFEQLRRQRAERVK